MEKRSIGSFISVLRKANGLTQRQLAEQLNVSDKAVSRWERDEALPDLTLIPVLADIFGVTSDELLRGQRNVNDTPPPQAEEKSKKQLKYLLDKAKTDYQIKTLICVMVALLGLMAAAIVNLGFLRAVAGFWVGCVFFLVAAVLQAVFAIQVRGKLNTEEFDEEAICDCKKHLLRRTLGSYSITAILFAFTLPLATLMAADYAYAGLRFPDWMLGGLVAAAITAVLAFAICLPVYYKKTNYTPCSPEKKRLRLRTALILAAVCVGSFVLESCAAEVLQSNLHWLGTASRHDSFEMFQMLMETPSERGLHFLRNEYDEDGKLCAQVYSMIGNTGQGELQTYRTFYAVEAPWKGEVYSFIDANQDILRVKYTKNAIYTLDREQCAAAYKIYDGITYAFLAVYPIEILIAVLIYRKKAKALPAA